MHDGWRNWKDGCFENALLMLLIHIHRTSIALHTRCRTPAHMRTETLFRKIDPRERERHKKFVVIFSIIHVLEAGCWNGREVDVTKRIFFYAEERQSAHYASVSRFWPPRVSHGRSPCVS
jgi:hypothetical protein